jgi:hypothetical protein
MSKKNKATKSKAGRPAKYKTAEELQAAIDAYFEKPDKRVVFLKDGMPVEIPVITITGLVLRLGFVNRASFYDLEADPRFSNTIKTARTRIEYEYEKMLQTGVASASAIFALKNFGWRDESKIDISNPDGTMTPRINIYIPDNGRSDRT